MATSIKHRGWQLDKDKAYLAALFNSTEVFRITASAMTLGQALSPTTSDGAALGTSSLMWSDLFLASGGVINFNNGAVTMTHSGQTVNVASTWATAEATGRPFAVNLTTNVSLGSYANAFKAYVNCSSVGGATGLLSAGNFEITFPTTGIAGTTVGVEIELTYGATCGALQKPAFFYLGTNGTARGDFDTYGDFMKLSSNITAGAGYMLSANTQTLRVGTGSLSATKRYLVMSQIENGLGLGTSGTPQTCTYNGTKQFSLYTTCASTDTGTSWEPQYIKNVATGAGQVGCRFRIDLDTDVELGSWANAFKASVTLNDNGATGGLISAICAEMYMPTGNNAGNYTCLELEMTMPASGSGSLVIPSFMYCNGGGTQIGVFDDFGYFFILAGVNSGSAHLWYDKGSAITPGDCGEVLRVKTPGGTRYIALYDSFS